LIVSRLDEDMADLESIYDLPIDDPEPNPEFMPVLARRGRGRPPSRKSKTKAGPKPQVNKTRSKSMGQSSARRRREEETTHADIKSKLNNGSAVRRLRSGSNLASPETPTPLSIEGTTPLAIEGTTPGDNMVAAGDARAAHHEDLAQSGGLMPPPPRSISRPISHLIDRMAGERGDFRLAHNRKEDYAIMQLTSSIVGESSEVEDEL
jgi:hypothetical protein